MSDAEELVIAIINELKRGTKHYNATGRLLETPIEIVNTMRNGGKVYFDCPPQDAG